MKVYLTSLGCRLNEAELQTWSKDFSKLGIAVTSDRDEANLMVINTCAVTGEAARKSRQAIRRLHRSNPSAKLVVTGCYASLEKQQAQEILGVDLIVANSDKENLAAKSRELLDWSSMPVAASEPQAAALFARNRERAFIKIQDGCRYRCTYCIVTIARGEEKSRSIKEIIEEIHSIESQGIQEIVITGVHVGGFGSDNETSLYQLVQSILEQTTIPRIRFASVEPWDLQDDFFELFRNPRLLPHMHLPMQSGSDKILKKMSRRCKMDSFLSLIKKARSVVPGFNITSDIIVGFPFETEEDFQASIELVEQAEFGHVHTFAFSKRAGTKAAGLEQQVEESIKKRRSQAMHQCAAKVKKQQLLQLLGQQVDVLWEGRGKKLENGLRKFYGYTPNYHKVATEVAAEYALSNQILSCRISKLTDDGCLYADIEPKKLELVTRLAVENI
ncbi:MAG: tRNA (N(6)-L-threonylcarbamoyladenosine(37)-C(2))-methylthiotransferase MtaB [Enterobacterales bacterium]|nr:tRNA (N(6)-L-threonylcarbamoyladenosine(37)-C(2))-methylthiotransferase MtaB [Enterobacterales bacterium]